MTKRLNVPYKSQLDNRNNPYGSCNVSCIAMCLEFLKAKRYQPEMQFEDELYNYMISKGLDRHNPEHLAQVVRDYGATDNYRPDGTISQAKVHIDNGSPCVIHGWFTEAGHVITVVGYNDSGLICHDPYGEWFRHGYDTTVSGANLTYSYKMIEQLAMPDGGLWLHRISK